MHPRRRLRAPLLALLVVVVAVGLAGCGSWTDDPDPVADGARETTAPKRTTTTAPPPGGIESPVPGMTAHDLRRVVEAAGKRPSRALTGPVAEKVLLDGQQVWRVRIPGHFVARAARVNVSVGGQPVGIGVVTSLLDALVAVPQDVAVLTDGAAVSYQWEGEQPVDAGRLVVVP